MPGRRFSGRSRPYRSARLPRARGGFSPFSATPLTASSSNSTSSVTAPASVTINASNNNFATQASSSASSIMSDVGEPEGTNSSPDGDVKDMIRSMDCRVRSLEDKTIKLTSAIKELGDLMKKYCKNSFTIKGSPFEAPLKSELAKLFCLSVERRPSDNEVQEAIKQVLGREARDKYKFDIAFTFAKNKLTELRTEERRKVIGLGIFEDKQYLSTDDLCAYLIQTMQPSNLESSVYLQHLAILRKFVRECINIPSSNFYGAFREWLEQNYSQLDSDTYALIMEEDKSIDYGVTGSGMHEVEVENFETNDDPPAS